MHTGCRGEKFLHQSQVLLLPQSGENQVYNQEYITLHRGGYNSCTGNRNIEINRCCLEMVQNYSMRILVVTTVAQANFYLYIRLDERLCTPLHQCYNYTPASIVPKCVWILHYTNSNTPLKVKAHIFIGPGHLFHTQHIILFIATHIKVTLLHFQILCFIFMIILRKGRRKKLAAFVVNKCDCGVLQQ